MVLFSRDISRGPYIQNTQCFRKISPHFSWYGKKPKIHELRAFGWDI